jgi:hypothetical protein
LSDVLMATPLENILPGNQGGLAISPPISTMGDRSIKISLTDHTRLSLSSSPTETTASPRSPRRAKRWDDVSLLLSSYPVPKQVLSPNSLRSATNLGEPKEVSVGTATTRRDTSSGHDVVARATFPNAASPRSSSKSEGKKNLHRQRRPTTRSPKRGMTGTTRPIGAEERGSDPIGDDHDGGVQRIPVVGPNDAAESSHARSKSPSKSRRRRTSPQKGGGHQGDNGFSEFAACDEFGFVLSSATATATSSRSKSPGTVASRAVSPSPGDSLIPNAWMRQMSEDRFAGSQVNPSKRMGPTDTIPSIPRSPFLFKESCMTPSTSCSSPRKGRKQRLSVSERRERTGDPFATTPVTLDDKTGKRRWVSPLVELEELLSRPLSHAPGPDVISQSANAHSSETVSHHRSRMTGIPEPSRHRPIVSSESRRLRSRSHDGRPSTIAHPERSSHNHRNRARSKNCKSSASRSPVSPRKVYQEGEKARIPASTRKALELVVPRSSKHSTALPSSMLSSSLRSTAMLANRITIDDRKKNDESTPKFDLTSPTQMRRQRILQSGGRCISNPDLLADGANFGESNSVRRHRHHKRSSMPSESMAMVNQSNSTTSFDFPDFDATRSSPPTGPEQQKQQVWFRRRLRVQGEGGVATDDILELLETAHLRHEVVPVAEPPQHRRRSFGNGSIATPRLSRSVERPRTRRGH